MAAAARAVLLITTFVVRRQSMVEKTGAFPKARTGHARPGSPEVVDAARIYLHRVVSRNKAILAVSQIVFLGLGALFLAKTKPLYESTSQLLLMKDYGALSNTSIVGPGMYGDMLSDDMLATQVVVITSPMILNKAIQMGGLRQLPSLAEMAKSHEGDLVECLREHLVVTRGGADRTLRDASVMNIAFRAHDPYEASEVLKAIHDAYEDFLQTSAKEDTTKTAELLKAAKQQLEENIGKQNQAYEEFLKNSPVFWTGSSGELDNLARQAMVDLHKAHSAAQIQLNDLLAQIEILEQGRQQGLKADAMLKTIAATRPDTVLIDRAVEAENPALQTLRSAYLSAQQERAQLAESFGPKHPKVLESEARLKSLSGMLAEASIENRVFEVQNSTPEAKLAAAIDSLRMQADITKRRVDLLQKEFDARQEDAKGMLLVHFKDQEHRNTIDNSSKFFDAVVRRLDEINVVKDNKNGFRTRLIAPPTVGLLVFPNKLVVLALCVAGGLALGLTLGTLKELSHTRLSTVEEIRAHARGIGVWRVNRLDARTMVKSSADSSMDESLVAFHAPNSIQAECFRGIRTSLYFHARTSGQHVFQVTSARPAEGKTTISANLAISLAQTGKRTLLVDADLRRSRLHRLFGIEPGLGLTDALEDDIPLASCCHPTEQESLFLLPRGSRTQRPSELLMSPRLQEILQGARSDFDFVIIDSPPLLAVSDASSMAAYVDGMILVVSLEGARRRMLADSLELLDSFGAAVSAIVANFVGGNKSGYYGYEYNYEMKDAS